jgi:hypothetical protein
LAWDWDHTNLSKNVLEGLELEQESIEKSLKGFSVASVICCGEDKRDQNLFQVL